MKVPEFLVPVCLFVFVFGCSGEDQSSGPPPSPKVVQTIKQPLPEQAQAPVEAEEKKSEQAPDEKPATPKEKPPVTSKDEALERPSTVMPQGPAAEKPSAPAKAAQETPEKPGYYVVKKGDTLSKVASRQDTMRDPLKWPILLRLNLDKLSALTNGEDFATRELPTGIELRYITPREAKEGLKKPSESRWVVNVISASTEAEIVPPAVILSRQGYPVYITRAYVKGKDYLRLRVGFFESGKEAREQGEKIRSLLNLQDFWATKADDVEYEEVAGFLRTP
jgi:LysM repeat protein